MGRHPPEVRGGLGEKYPPCQGRSAPCGGDRRGQHWEAAPPQREGRCMGVKTSSQREGDFAGGQTWVKNQTQHSTGSGPCSDRPKGGSDFDPIETSRCGAGGSHWMKSLTQCKTQLGPHPNGGSNLVGLILVPCPPPRGGHQTNCSNHNSVGLSPLRENHVAW